MIVYRICNTRYANDINGIGSKLYGGRWNNVGLSLLYGNAVVYSSSTRALAALEVLVHLPPKNVKLMDFSLVAIEVPENNVDEISYAKIKDELIRNGLNSNFKLIGDNWLKKNTTLLLKVPSVVIPEEFNFLINPLHKDFHKVKIKVTKLFRFDERLVVK
jgi:RES domain-containing protein